MSIRKEEIERDIFLENFDFTITLKGKKKSIIKFVKFIQAVKRDNVYIGSLNVNVDTRKLNAELKDGEVSVKLSGYGGTSVRHSMLNRHSEAGEEKIFIDKVRELGLEVEIFAISYVGSFEEHLLITENEVEYDKSRITIVKDEDSLEIKVEGGYSSKDVIIEDYITL